jgi:hypothetical protein
LKIGLVEFAKIVLVGASQKNSFQALKKWKVNLLCNEIEKSLWQHRSPSQDAHACIIWAHYHKLCHSFGHNNTHLGWKPWKFVHGSPFLEDFLKIFAFFQVYNFSSQLGLVKWHNAKVFYFFNFFWISYAGFKMRSKRRTWPFIARIGILRKCD